MYGPPRCGIYADFCVSSNKIPIFEGVEVVFVTTLERAIIMSNPEPSVQD